ncbi:hypothetical protein BP00DRAFT_495373 [Aspergillus indologenus CBS 114.80]|uniref:MFS general substrate transporter n=1 Tax=Aspergillus indologenus CBS 114.80 TaxID=1450541 RepID=A0A2V5I3A6_9EURO|nr:hypothetical protein BP00DRAFT_495373 [Aspergillus indologenus CBS 114.80]
MPNTHLRACSFNDFFPTLVGSRGFNPTMTLVHTCPPDLVSGVCSIVIGTTSGRYNERTGHITGSMGAAVLGFLIACGTLNPAARDLACSLFASGAYAVNVVIRGWVAATLGQCPAKKAASLSVVNVVANASSVYTAYLYPRSDGPRYLVAMAANAAFGVLTVASAWALRGWLRRTNRAIREGRVSGEQEGLLYAY